MNKDIKDLIKSRKLMLKDISKNLGVNASTLRRWLSEEIPEDRRNRLIETINATVPKQREKRGGYHIPTKNTGRKEKVKILRQLGACMTEAQENEIMNCPIEEIDQIAHRMIMEA